MSVALYMDVHIRWAITAGLRRRGVDVLSAQEDGAARYDDPALLDRATQLGRVLVSQDDDLFQEAARRQAAGERFSGVVYSHQLRITVGQAIRDLDLLASVYEPVDMENRVEYLPLSGRWHELVNQNRLTTDCRPPESASPSTGTISPGFIYGFRWR